VQLSNRWKLLQARAVDANKAVSTLDILCPAAPLALPNNTTAYPSQVSILVFMVTSQLWFAFELPDSLDIPLCPLARLPDPPLVVHAGFHPVDVLALLGRVGAAAARRAGQAQVDNAHVAFAICHGRLHCHASIVRVFVAAAAILGAAHTQLPKFTFLKTSLHDTTPPAPSSETHGVPPWRILHSCPFAAP
jgi:hypothetical protein